MNTLILVSGTLALGTVVYLTTRGKAKPTKPSKPTPTTKKTPLDPPTPAGAGGSPDDGLLIPKTNDVK